MVGGLAGGSERHDVVLNPYTGQPVGEVHLADAADAERALQHSVVGARAMRALPPHAVAGILDRAAALVEARAEEFASLIVAEAGKPLYDARGEVARSILNLRAAAEESKRVAGHEVPLEVDGAVSAYQGRRGESDGGRRRLAVTRRVPIGVVLAVTPFNFPLNLVLHKVAPALASRNAVILKPAPQTPLTGLLLGEVLIEAGLPPQALSVLPCANDVAELLVRDDRVAMLTFTGSARVGWYLKSCAGKKRVTLELGGNGGVLIDKSCEDLGYAAQRACRGGFVFAGQYCIGVERILVHRSRYEEFLHLLLTEVDQLVLGDPADEITDVGPVIDAGSADRIESWIGEARAAGAELLRGGCRTGNVITPTLLTGTAPGTQVEDEEIFGPVVTVNPVDSWSDGLSRLNGSRYGLQLGVFTNDIGKAMSAADTLDAGTVVVNDAPIYRIDTMPFGGVKDSGTGREGTKYAMDSMTDTKLVVFSASIRETEQ